MPSLDQIPAALNKNGPKRREKWQVLCRNNIIFLTEFANYVLL